MNLANRITLARIFLVPIVTIFLLVKLNIEPLTIGSYSISYNQVFALLLFIIAASTDGLDGYIARKRKIVTNLGKLLDPLADKLLMAAVLIALVQMEKLGAWVAIIIISREWAVTGLRQVALLEGAVLAASKWGKWKTAVQITMIIVLLLNNFPFNFIDLRIDWVVIWASVLITVYSGIDYFVKNKNLIPVSD
ncbi:CDP-diacylglycerol--glycerol-3-phosphate 3-phosphatidyltransferase [Cohnella endophytica]|uniref:CDP-diacylglycerol--glycerol-3-phosphate 3-phosphatidyltransferase n=1 Tax=Cohnella endophytica TaxID=2419778 RepID=A0A494XYC5_9BACL|nr:CDP-diacylglycerol--glycerol-3-phosphate 3-phosphatidyltransferase [Cohnella endophytica]RKP55527.1 CDP-diacylglycerol--glycerol-3-phosphate 3-phosphatidyltransferase [Cohnella endophytica]